MSSLVLSKNEIAEHPDRAGEGGREKPKRHIAACVLVSTRCGPPTESVDHEFRLVQLKATKGGQESVTVLSGL